MIAYIFPKILHHVMRITSRLARAFNAHLPFSNPIFSPYFTLRSSMQELHVSVKILSSKHHVLQKLDMDPIRAIRGAGPARWGWKGDSWARVSNCRLLVKRRSSLLFFVAISIVARGGSGASMALKLWTGVGDRCGKIYR